MRPGTPGDLGSTRLRRALRKADMITANDLAFRDVFGELRWRGMMYDATAGAQAVLEETKVTCYAGFDPSARSLHIGNLIPIMGLVHMQRHGHSPIAIVGGGTGMIGDPGGRSTERQLLAAERIEENVAGIRGQLRRFLDFDESLSNPARLVNNAEWLAQVRLIDFLRDVGKHFTVNYMTAKESVKARLERKAGISYSEFSYMLLQAYDFLLLYERYGCTFQMGGSDQWGNILAGVDLIRRVHGSGTQGPGPAHAMVYPLITTASGEKFGKSIGGAPTLDPDETSPYKLYQFFLNTDDKDVIPYLKLFTLLGPADIDELEQAVAAEPSRRAAQRRLAREVALAVHGQDGLAQAERVTSALFGGDLAGLGVRDLEELFEGAPGGELPRSQLEAGGLQFQRIAVSQGVCASTGEVRRLVEQGGLYLNGTRVSDPGHPVRLEDLIDGRLLVIRRGARSHHLVRVIG